MFRFGRKEKRAYYTPRVSQQAKVQEPEIAGCGLVEVQKPKPEYLQISVAGYGWEGSILARPTETVHAIQERLSSQFLIPTPPILTLGRSMPTLQTDKTLKFYGINQESKLWFINPKLLLTIKMPQLGETILIRDYDVNKIGKRRIVDIISAKTRITDTHHNYHFVERGRFLRTFKIASSIVFVMFGQPPQNPYIDSLPLSVVVANRQYHVIDVKPWFAFFDVKCMIESATDIPVRVQELWFNQRKLEDWEVVSNFNMVQWAVIHVKIISTPVKLFIKTNHDIPGVELDVNNSDTVDVVMKMIKSLSCLDIQPSLFLDDNRLEGDKLLAQYDIKSGSTLMLDTPVEREVTTPDGKTIVVVMRKHFPKGDLKQKIEEICGIPYEVLLVTPSIEM